MDENRRSASVRMSDQLHENTHWLSMASKSENADYEGMLAVALLESWNISHEHFNLMSAALIPGHPLGSELNS